MSGHRSASVDTTTTTTVRSASNWPFGLFVVWVFGVTIVVVRTMFSWLCLIKLSRRGEPESDGFAWERLEELKKRCSIKTPVNLLITQRGFGPMTWGLRNPWIALPESARDWKQERIDAVLLHELAHIKRRDSVTEWLCQVACAVQWWNPLVWYVCRRLRMERENACDDVALAQGIEPSPLRRNCPRYRCAEAMSACRSHGNRVSAGITSQAHFGWRDKPLFRKILVNLGICFAIGGPGLCG